MGSEQWHKIRVPGCKFSTFSGKCCGPLLFLELFLKLSLAFDYLTFLVGGFVARILLYCGFVLVNIGKIVKLWLNRLNVNIRLFGLNRLFCLFAPVLGFPFGFAPFSLLTRRSFLEPSTFFLRLCALESSAVSSASDLLFVGFCCFFCGDDSILFNSPGRVHRMKQTNFR